MATRQLPNWLDAYDKYTSNSESPESYHQWCGVSTIASALQRKCVLNLGIGAEFYPNLYVVLVGPTACGKGTAMSFAARLQKEVKTIHTASNATSLPALIRTMKKIDIPIIDEEAGTMAFHASLTIFSTELTVFIGQKESKLLSHLCDWFDCLERWEYDTISRDKEVIHGVWVNLLGATTPENIVAALPPEAIAGGLTSRIIFVVERKRKQLVVFPTRTPEQAQLEKDLIEDLRTIHEMSGEFKWADEAAAGAYADFAVESDQNPPFVGDSAFQHYAGRRRNHLLSTALCMSAARSSEMRISVDDLQRAISLLISTEKRMNQAFRGLGSPYAIDAG